MKKILLLLNFFKKSEPQPRLSLKEQLAMLDMSNDHLIIQQPKPKRAMSELLAEIDISDNNLIDLHPKKLNLEHNPKTCKTVEVNVTFNQRSYHLRRQLKKGLPRLKKVS